MPKDDQKKDEGEEKPGDVEPKYLRGLTNEEVSALGLA